MKDCKFLNKISISFARFTDESRRCLEGSARMEPEHHKGGRGHKKSRSRSQYTCREYEGVGSKGVWGVGGVVGIISSGWL